jgi:hypothetical protein
MLVGFLGTLIGLERAVALGKAWSYGIPILTGSSALTLFIALPVQLSGSLAAAASLILLMVFVALYRQYPSEHFVVMGVSALAWFMGNVLWLSGSAIFLVAPWWVAFLVLMIAGERLELSRLRQPPSGVRLAFHLSLAVASIGTVYSLFDFHVGLRIAGAGLLMIALWLLRYDLVWQSAKQTGLPRFMAICLIAGYGWLVAGGLLWITFAEFFSAGPVYDAMLHAIFLGFVFSMIFAHAPIILPTITGLRLPFENLFYLHAALLHLSVLARVAGDLVSWLALQRWGGLLNTLAVFLFLANNIRAVTRSASSGVKDVRKSNRF